MTFLFIVLIVVGYEIFRWVVNELIKNYKPKH